MRHVASSLNVAAKSHPAPLSQYDLSVYNRTLSDASAAKLKAGEPDIHFFSIPLIVDSERFEIQLEFRVGVETKEVITSVLFGVWIPNHKWQPLAVFVPHY